eukprot:363407-Amphidinium_carterae.1
MRVASTASQCSVIWTQVLAMALFCSYRHDYGTTRKFEEKLRNLSGQPSNTRLLPRVSGNCSCCAPRCLGIALAHSSIA